MGKQPKVCIMGLGYIGLPTAAVIASRGMQVVGVDVTQRVIDTINQGKIHIKEPDLDVAVRSVVIAGNLKACLKPEVADIFIIAVPTPFKDGKKPDLRYVEAAANAIAPVLRKGNLVILESTSPVGTTEKLSEWLAHARPDLHFPHDSDEAADICVAHCPERVLPGKILMELITNDRVVGGITPECAQQAADFYKKFVSGACLLTNARTAEMAKLTENTFRDVNIAFANELSLICDELNIDVWELISLANRHPRVNILQPGPGVGGHCIAVDPWFVVDSAPETARLTKLARQINDIKPEFVVRKIRELAENHQNPTICCLGLAFKANVDDLRESPAMEIVKLLAEDGQLAIKVVEPNIAALPEALGGYSNIEFEEDRSHILDADICVLLVAHREFENLESFFPKSRDFLKVSNI